MWFDRGIELAGQPKAGACRLISLFYGQISGHLKCSFLSDFVVLFELLYGRIKYFSAKIAVLLFSCRVKGGSLFESILITSIRRIA